MRLLDRWLVQAFAESFDVQEPILEIGAHQLVAGNPLMDLRPFFPHKKYIGSDMRPGPGVDQVYDGSCLGLKDRSVGTVVTVSTVEHVFDIFGAFKEILRVLSDKGAMLVTSHMDCGIHGYPSDYWRFTPEAFYRLLEPLPARVVGYQGLSYHPHAVFALGFTEAPTDFQMRVAQFQSRLEQCIMAWSSTRPVRDKMTLFRRRVFWRIFGSKDAYRKLRDENTIGWHCVSPKREVW